MCAGIASVSTWRSGNPATLTVQTYGQGQPGLATGIAPGGGATSSLSIYGYRPYVSSWCAVGPDCVQVPQYVIGAGNSACVSPNAPDPGSIGGVALNVTTVAPQGNDYGNFWQTGDVAVDVTPYYDSGTKSWKTRITSASASADTFSRLLPGQNEASLTAATQANYCVMVSDPTSLGEPAGPWYMVEAVQARENVHKNELIGVYAADFPSLKNQLEALSVPFTCGDTVATAEAAIKALPAYAQAVGNWNTRVGNDFNPISDPNAPTNPAEHAVVDPVVNSISNKATSQKWTPCP